jgi:hypothetical protein
MAPSDRVAEGERKKLRNETFFCFNVFFRIHPSIPFEKEAESSNCSVARKRPAASTPKKKKKNNPLPTQKMNGC